MSTLMNTSLESERNSIIRIHNEFAKYKKQVILLITKYKSCLLNYAQLKQHTLKIESEYLELIGKTNNLDYNNTITILIQCL